MLVFHSLSIWAYKLRHFLIGQEIKSPKEKKDKELKGKSWFVSHYNFFITRMPCTLIY